VVDKEELLSALWPGVIVTDASLQRAVSLARTALREGGVAGAIRTYARRGYRFCLEPTARNGAKLPAANPLLTSAHSAFGEKNWGAASEAFALADQLQPLTADALESWAIAAQCAGSLRDAVAPLERASAGHLAAGDKEGAARAILVLARIQLELREINVTRACLRRAGNLLEHLPTGAQHGHLSWMTSRTDLADGRLEQARDNAMNAIAIARQLSNPDIEAIGTLCLGIALQASGDTPQGLELQGEAAASVVSGNVSPLIGGLVYCGLLSGYFNAGELQRAAQWTDSFTRWCERSKVQLFNGSCLLHRAEIYAVRGELARAELEIVNGDNVLRLSAPWAIGNAQQLIGDLHLARGAFEAAESAYRSAHEHAWEPYPGYALLLHYRGQSGAALRGLRNAATKTNWVAGEKHGMFLAYIVIIAALSGDLASAKTTLVELDGHPDAWAAGAVKAQVWRARAELMLAQAQWEGALHGFRQAVQILLDLDARLDTAVMRLRLAACLAAAGDAQSAESELLAARKPLEKAGARFYLTLCAQQQDQLAGFMDEGIRVGPE